MKKYDLNYEGGKCPMGQEYVAGYRRKDGVFVNAHCRKLKRHVRDDFDHGMSTVEIANPFDGSQ